MKRAFKLRAAGRRRVCGFLLPALLLGGCLFLPSTLNAGGVVAECTEAALLEALAGGGEVLFEDNCDITVTGTIDITNDTVISLSGELAESVSLRGGSSVRIFNVRSNVTFTLDNIEVADGFSTNGGGMFIERDAVVTLNNCIFSGNQAVGSNGAAGANGRNGVTIGDNGGNGGNGGSALGGAIYNRGVLSALGCRFEEGTATGGDGGPGGNGGSGSYQGGDGGRGGSGGAALGAGIFNLGSLLVSNCTFELNSAYGGYGGSGGTNGAGAFPSLAGHGGAGAAGSGAGLYNQQTGVVVACTFLDNFAQGGDSMAGGSGSNGYGKDGSNGGGGSGGGIFNLGDMTVTNSTFYVNATQGGTGGDGGPGSFRGGDGGDGGSGSGGNIHNSGAIYLLNCTVDRGAVTGGTNGLAGSGPFPGSDGSMGVRRGGNIANAGSCWLKNSIVAGGSPVNGYGTITDAGYNISSDNSIALGANSFKNTDPKLDVLANNGGPTLTILLLSNSPAINAADAEASPTVDQRGESRPYAGGYDIGAVENTTRFFIRGRITEGTVGVAGIRVSIGSSNVLTDASGNYVLTDLISRFYRVAPQPQGFFAPVFANVTLNSNRSDINFSATRARITGIQPTNNNQMLVSFVAVPRQTYRVQASTGFTNWVAVSTNTAPTNGVFQFLDASAVGFTSRYYRTVRP